MDCWDLIILLLISLLPVGQEPEAKGIMKAELSLCLCLWSEKNEDSLGQEEGWFCFSISCVKPQSDKVCQGDLFGL